MISKRDLLIAKKMAGSVLLKMYPDIWKTHEFGGVIGYYGKLCFCWKPKSKPLSEVVKEEKYIDGVRRY